MKSQPSRVSFTVLATFLFLVAALEPTTSHPSIPAVSRRAPDPSQLRLADWVAGRAGGDLSVMRPQDLQAALDAKRQGFELFSPSPDLREERKLLIQLPFGHAIWRAALRNRMDGLLLAAVVETESRFSAKAVSPEGAVGLMQVIPETGHSYGRADLFDPDVNLEVGSRYLASLIDRYRGDLTLAVAAYNAGPAAVTRYGGVPPFRETRAYVRDVLGLYAEHRQRLWKAQSASLELPPLTRARVGNAHSLSDPAPQAASVGLAR